MALWTKIISHPDFGLIRPLYNDIFPLEVRFVCANWIEERIRPDLFIDTNDPLIEQKAANFLHSLIQQLECEKEKLNRTDELSMKHRLDEAIQTFIQHFYHPLVIYKQIRDIILSEQYLLENYSEKPQISKNEQDDNEIMEKLKKLHSKVVVNKGECSRKKFEILESISTTDGHQYPTGTTANELFESFATVIIEIDTIQQIVLNRLKRWQRHQALSCNGGTVNIKMLDEIQSWFEKLAEIIWTTRCSIDELRDINSEFPMDWSDVIDRYYSEITILLQTLIVSGFIVEEQPPQVMKTNTRFNAKVRLLTTNLGIQQKNPSVVASILSELQCWEKQQKNVKPLDTTSGEILHNKCTLEIENSTQHLSCNLRSMQLKKIKRTEKKGTEAVTDEKFTLLFQTTLETGDIQINVWVMSLPVVVIVHGNQEPQSWATITWDNAFSAMNRVPFHVVDKVIWHHMASALEMKFTNQTGGSLTTANLHYLCEKLFQTTVNFDPSDREISWSRFCKELLPGRTFSFWDWFYAAMKLIGDHLKREWSKNLIIGFIDRHQAEELLLQCPAGTFLLRLSDSGLGRITIAWVEMNPTPTVVHVQPFCSRDLAIRSLSDRIKDLHQCKTLYPDIPKDCAFGKFYSLIDRTTTNGYVKPILKTTILSATTKYNEWQSSDHTRDTFSVECMVPEPTFLPSFADLKDDVLMFG